jgi:hypothetical protein
MKWKLIPASGVVPAMSVSGKYVIAHRWQRHTVTYSRKEIGSAKSAVAARAVAADHKRALVAARKSAAIRPTVAAFTGEIIELPGR